MFSKWCTLFSFSGPCNRTVADFLISDHWTHKLGQKWKFMFFTNLICRWMFPDFCTLFSLLAIVLINARYQSRPRLFVNFRSCDSGIKRSKIWIVVQCLPCHRQCLPWFKNSVNDTGLTSALLHDIRCLDFHPWHSETRLKMENAFRIVWCIFIWKWIGDDRQSQSGLFFNFRSCDPEMGSKFNILNCCSPSNIKSTDLKLHKILENGWNYDYIISFFSDFSSRDRGIWPEVQNVNISSSLLNLGISNFTVLY